MKKTPLRPSRVRWTLLAALVIGGAATAQGTPAGLPPPGTMSAQMPKDVDMYFSMVVSDAAQQVSQNMGVSAAEARIRTLQECREKQKDCVELVTFPIRNHCMGIAVDKKPRPNVRALFVNVAEVSKTKPGELARTSLAQCKSGGGTQCESQSDYCF
ncbi:MAG: DUF4189 domain-containing protein [Stenotrophomonas sp.]|uniref:DUF4189 domain-containing protein n=1 Tax=Stenotrophomonas sp. TaxID=69392 RepID=UPI003D6D9F18